jgi:hypothetical protein
MLRVQSGTTPEWTSLEFSGGQVISPAWQATLASVWAASRWYPIRRPDRPALGTLGIGDVPEVRAAPSAVYGL